MQAMVIVPSTDSGTLDLRTMPDPVPGLGELLVRVKATALNRTDLAQRRGAYPAPVKAADTSAGSSIFLVPRTMLARAFSNHTADAPPKTTLE
jgi:NADPH:quinone reductase-like Zn-dependent oxidoreductase